MNLVRMILPMMMAAVFAVGCVASPREQEMLMQRQREDNLMLQEELRRLRARLDAVEDDMQRMNQQVSVAGAEQTRAVQGQMQGINATLDDLNKRIRAVDAAREQDKKEIVNKLSSEMAELMRRQQAATRSTTGSRPRQVSDTGYEHVVQSGETLSAIAKAYGVTTADIVAANNLADANNLRVGQKLFVPVP
ncbi:MAG: LysM peptidoglycan-binding domain-containing protein [Kiritimatiellia bacterium]|jgi:LysM repeat protein